MLKLRENGLNIDYMYETNSVLRKTAETEISDLTFWLRFGSVRVFINRNRTEIRFPHIPSTGISWQVNRHTMQDTGPALVVLSGAVLGMPEGNGGGMEADGAQPDN